MIDLYTWSTPNGRKVSILLEELGLAYKAHPIDIGNRAQFTPEFPRISPNNKIPAIVDSEAGLIPMESGAILLYLVEKAGLLVRLAGEGRWRVIEWLMWQMGGSVRCSVRRITSCISGPRFPTTLPSATVMKPSACMAF